MKITKYKKSMRVAYIQAVLIVAFIWLFFMEGYISFENAGNNLFRVAVNGVDVGSVSEEEEAEELAYFELSRILGDMAEESTMISKTVTPIIGENSFVLYCKIGVIEDIAELSEIDTRIFEGEAAN